MEQLNINRTPHCYRHTCISMLAEAGVNQTIIKKIVGHSGAMTLTEKVYTPFDIKELVDTINQILWQAVIRRLLLKKYSIHINTFVAYVLHLCCI